LGTVGANKYHTFLGRYRWFTGYFTCFTNSWHMVYYYKWH
jgi:hypothetical protein